MCIDWGAWWGLEGASKFKSHCIVHIKIKTFYFVYLKMIWYHNRGYFQVIFYDHSHFWAGKKTEHGEYARPKIGIWYVIEWIYDIEGINRDCMISTRHGFFEIRINHRYFLWWLDKKCDVNYDIDNGLLLYRSSISWNDSITINLCK